MLNALSFFDLDFDRAEVPAVSSAGTPYVRRIPIGMPRLAPHFLDCAVFLYRTREDALAGSDSGGTGFFLQLLSPRFPTTAAYYFVVSNWHVVCKDGFPVVRVPTLDGGVDVFDLDSSEWHFVAGGYDVAIAPVALDFKKHRVQVAAAHAMVTREAFAQYQIGLGEDCFMIGRFVDHDADAPTVRFGNVSMLPAPIEQENGAVREAYCLDMRSRSGYSGSPVFVYRTPGFDLVDGKTADGQPKVVVTTGDKLLMLLGVHWGQFNEYWKIIGPKNAQKSEAALERKGEYIKGLSGMTCVVPAWAIMETIENTKLKDFIAAADEELAAKIPLQSGRPEGESSSGARPSEPEPPTTPEGDEKHRERFTALQDAVLGTPKRGD